MAGGKLLCPWPKPTVLTDQGRAALQAELAEITSRLADARIGGRLGPLGSWVTEDRIAPFTIQSVDWLRRMAADGVVVPVRVPSSG